MKPLVVANWKMNPVTRAAARGLFRRISRGLRRIRGVEVEVAPPYPYLGFLSPNRTLAIAAQDAAAETNGAYTGEVSSPMLRDLGVRYVILGHSERRRYFGEDDQLINRKLKSCLAAGLTPILAIGEELEDAADVVPEILARELAAALAGVPRRRLATLVVAYEPTWAIGGGRASSPDNATRRAIYIRKLLTKHLGHRVAERIRILYGGSVTSKNAAEYLTRDIRGMDGLLIGGASLAPEEFLAIVRQVSTLPRRP